MNRIHFIAVFLLISTINSVASSLDVDLLSKYNVTWNSPSQDHNGSMPIGNGDTGMNVWVEQNGDLVLLLSKTDAWSENAALLKLGRVRLSFSPNPFADGKTFNQTLQLRTSDILIRAGEGEKEFGVHIWVDANNPVIHVSTVSKSEHDVSAKLDVWRKQKRELKDNELNRVYGLQSAPFPVYSYPDTVCEGYEDQIVWYHRNQHSIWQDNLKHQGMEAFIQQSSDPLMNLTFGGGIIGEGLKNDSPDRLVSTSPQKNFDIAIYPLTSQTETEQEWLETLESNIKRFSANNLHDDLTKHFAWWDEFWNRSWIYVKGSDEAETVTRGYVLQRWVTACAGRGRFPIKFNGSIFTVDGDGFDADYRRWGGPYWWQNTRLPYWPMLACGDFDLMPPLFKMYQDMTPLAEFRTQTWFGHPGAFIGETVYTWGMYNNENYGWERDPDLPVSELTNTYIRREYTASLELLAMMIDYYHYTMDEAFLNDALLPMSDSYLAFWDKHYETNQDGYLVMYPAQALETLQDAKNPTPDVAGLHWVLKRLLALSEEQATESRIAFWGNLLKKIPPLITKDTDEGEIIAGAEATYAPPGNSENPELYTVFPFRLFGVEKVGIELARRTFMQRKNRGPVGWRQDDTQAAYLGLTDIAKDYLVKRASTKHDGSRFSAFWGPNFDWVPDQDHGGNLMKALQTMLLQTDDGKIYLTPAWPDDWDAEFKLHAPMQTTIEGKIKNGEITSLIVQPESRKKDVVIVEE
ncbi:MAG: DUF5703 domain-containing protein [Candidatus Hinthialibacter antarcticus]|nr:DUF5703 domain-containing protein [Candidatus Hinthialibacter antarcticus]